LVLDFRDAAHLLRRAGFGGRRSDVDALVGLQLGAAVQRVLSAPAAQSSTDTPGRLAQPEVDGENEYQLWVDLVQYWLDRMAALGSPVQEKLTLFWHGHFVSEQNKLYDSRRLWMQNQLFRRDGMGGFETLLQRVAIDPAMLMYLDNAFNTKGNQQENWAREVMELFTLGVDQYSQDDVVANARAWTGHGLADPWRDSGRTYVFRADKHDGDPKTIFGITRNWNGPEVLTEICRGGKRDVMARFIAAKVWSFIAFPNPPAGIVNDLAVTFVNTGLSITELVRAVFHRPEFWSDQARHGLVRSPAEYVAAVMRGVNRPAADLNPQWYMAGMGQELFNPPNVSGWKPNGYWLSTAAASARLTFGRNVMWRAMDPAKGWGFPVVPATVKNSGYSNEQLVTMALEAFGVFEPQPATVATLVEYVAANRQRWYCAHNLFMGVLACPEMHLA
jgi:uncharacterized protein (DUF1800 family)